ncbi:MAG: hypothetical protein MRZ79_03030 [Bacteroidia bacterium]|nr:hypothetical protein [Bacteroidia bacterium]
MKPPKHVWFRIFTLLMLVNPGIVLSQSASECKNNDCSPEIYSIKINEASKPADGIYSPQRTKNFIDAYKAFVQVSNTYSQSKSWKNKNENFRLNGSNCLRHNQLTSYFAKEYLQNPGFKSFIDKDYPNSNFMENGFQASRRALNLKKRMEFSCPEELKELEKKPGPSMANLPKDFKALGIELGYFNQQGEIQKTLDPAKLTKKQEIADLKQRLSQLPANQQMATKIQDIDSNLRKGKRRIEQIGKFVSAFLPIITTFIAPQIQALAQIKRIADALANLLGWQPKIPKTGLLGKISDLFQRANRLKEKAEGILDASKGLTGKTEGLGKQAEDVQNKLDQRIQKVEELKKQLEDLLAKKEDLDNKLNDKPKKILDELKQKVIDAEKSSKTLADEVAKESALKDKVLAQVELLEKFQEQLSREKERLQSESDQILGKKDKLAKENEALQDEVAQAKEEEDNLKSMNEVLADFPPGESLKESLSICEEDLKEILQKLNPAADTRTQIQDSYKKASKKPAKILENLKKLIGKQEKLKLPENGLAKADRTIKAVDGLLKKARSLTKIAETLTGKKSRLQEELEKVDAKFSLVQDAYNNRDQKLNELKGELVSVLADKKGLENQIKAASDGATDIEKAYQDFIKKYKIFEEESKCIDQKELRDKIEAMKDELDELKPEADEFKTEVQELETEKEILEEETDKLEELISEEESLKEKLGEDIELNPVEVKEWAENFEVRREYWDATFHPDDEVVKGYKGRWFKVNFKDAEKNVKLLFGPGKYFMDRADFRDSYGSVIGAFVTEALYSIRKAEEGSIKLFVQGSADITGQNTFKGKLDKKFFYKEVSILPYNSETDGFDGTSKTKAVSEKAFTNDDLPNLRGRYLKEMISIYSKKLEPILLEGTVKKKVDAGDRNAIVYLFIPEEIVDAYED